MLTLLSRLRQLCAIGYVGGSDLSKQQEQLGTSSIPVQTLFDYSFSENGLTAFKGTTPLAAQSFIGWLGDDRYKRLVNWCLHYIADLDIPIKRGTFVEFRNGMVNISPVGRNASKQERDDFQAYDKEAGVRPAMIEAMKKQFPDYGLTCVVPGPFQSCPRVESLTRYLQLLDRRPDLI